MQMNLFEAISQRGVIVTRGISFYRANKKLTKEDLGLSEVPSGMTLGHLKLLDDCQLLEDMKQIESDVGKEITNNTHDFCGLARFLPRERLEDLQSFIENKRDEFNALRDEFFSQYEVLKEQAVREWRAKAANGVSPDHYEEACRNAFPPLHKLRKKFKFHFAFLPLADMQGVNRANEINSMCDQFLADASEKINIAANRTLEGMMTALESGKWNQKTINSINVLVERIRSMSLVPDEELESRLAQFSQEFGDMKATEIKKDTKLEDRLKAGVAKLQEDITELGKRDILEEAKSKFINGAGRSID